MMTKPMGRLAYVALLEGPAEGRATDGWYLGIAEEGTKGYVQSPYGPFAERDAAKEKARELNAAMGLDQEAAFLIVASTMGKR